MSLWHRTILLVVGAVVVSAEETEKFVKQTVEELQKRVDRELKPMKESEYVHRPTRA